MISADAVEALLLIHAEKWNCSECCGELNRKDSFCERCAQDYNSECAGRCCSTQALYCDSCAAAKHGPQTVPYPPLGVLRIQDCLDDQLLAFLEASQGICCGRKDPRCIQCQDGVAILAALRARLALELR